MAFSTRQKVIAGIVAILAMIAGQIVIYQSFSFQTKAIIFRAEFVIMVECVMFLFSRILWRTVVPFIEETLLSPSPRSPVTPVSNGSQLSQQSLRKSKLSDANLSLHSSTTDNDDVQTSFSLLGIRFCKGMLIIYLGMCHISYFTNIFIIDTDPHWFGMLSYICLGSFVQFLTGLGMFKVLSFMIKMAKKRKYSGSLPSLLSHKHIVGLALVYMMAASTLGLYTASQPPKLRNVSIPIRNLPSNLEAITIVQLSDIHLGPTVGHSKLSMIVEMVQNEKPDFVVVTGDLVDGPVERLQGAAQPLSSIDAKYGKFFVSGNHEYYTGDVDNWFDYLKSLGFFVLHNSNIKIPARPKDGEGQICIAGTDDVTADKIGYEGHSFSLENAVDSCSDDMTVILLAHQPVAAKMAMDSSYKIDLVLSGHTHGGQMFPMIIGAYLLNPFYSGLYQYKDGHVYVSQGTQYWGIPMRIGTAMEITKIVLKKAE